MIEERAYLAQLVRAVEPAPDFVFRPNWDEVHPSLCWAWLTMGANIKDEFGWDSFVEGGFIWAYSKNKPVRRNGVGEYREGIAPDQGTPYRHFPNNKRPILVPLGIDYRQVLVQKKEDNVFLQPVYTDVGLRKEHREKLSELSSLLNMSAEEVLALAVDKLYILVKADDIKAEKVE